ncbi:MAG: DNA adenine methylase, partial [Victivallales bacterium]|nr:DNA adenine methylase [Victivallales bacterium]
LFSNGLERYSAVIGQCYLANRSQIDWARLQEHHRKLLTALSGELRSGLITELYAPKVESAIQPGERVFYTIRNARFLDTARQEIAALPPGFQPFFLAPLLYGASVHVNTSGVFKGFYKNQAGVGQYGGRSRNALGRILGDIELPLPVLSKFECECFVTQLEALAAARQLPESIDLAYLDPPYNNHPYGSNYFMLNLLLDYRRPADVSAVSGIPANWNRSAYNVRQTALDTLCQLIDSIPARYILISYNSEGFIKYAEFTKLLKQRGELTIQAKTYNTFRGSRNLRQRNIHVREYLFLLKKR